jgi:hypothetical protein
MVEYVPPGDVERAGEVIVKKIDEFAASHATCPVRSVA